MTVGEISRIAKEVERWAEERGVTKEDFYIWYSENKDKVQRFKKYVENQPKKTVKYFQKDIGWGYSYTTAAVPYCNLARNNAWDTYVVLFNQRDNWKQGFRTECDMPIYTEWKKPQVNVEVTMEKPTPVDNPKWYHYKKTSCYTGSLAIREGVDIDSALLSTGSKTGLRIHEALLGPEIKPGEGDRGPFMDTSIDNCMKACLAFQRNLQILCFGFSVPINNKKVDKSRKCYFFTYAEFGSPGYPLASPFCHLARNSRWDTYTRKLKVVEGQKRLGFRVN